MTPTPTPIPTLAPTTTDTDTDTDTHSYTDTDTDTTNADNDIDFLAAAPAGGAKRAADGGSGESATVPVGFTGVRALAVGAKRDNSDIGKKTVPT